MNEQLLALYEAAFPSLVQVRAGAEGVSWPLFVEAPSGYDSAPVKLLVVGQQTHDWGEGEPACAADVVAFYRGFDLGRHYRRTPFWRAAHHLYNLLCPGGPERAFVWSNLVKVCQHQVRPSPAVEEAVCRLMLLPQENWNVLEKLSQLVGGGPNQSVEAGPVRHVHRVLALPG